MSNSLSGLDVVAPGTGIEDALWSMSQRSRALQDLRKDIGQVWVDDAAREINGRYLDPLESDDHRMRTAMNEQSEHLEQAGRQLESANDFALQIDECSKVVTEKLRFAEQDMGNSYSKYDLYVHYNAEARSKFPLVRELIDHANSACE
jgi:hypothetical protein